jgi:hypothetical protein
MLIDQFMPEFHVTEHHQILIAAPPDVVFAALYQADLADSTITRALFWLRTLPARLGRRRVQQSERPKMTLANAIKSGFTLLGETAPTEVALGLVGRFWKATGGTRPNVSTAEEFLRFSEAGWAKSVMNFTVQPAPGGTLVTTETRTLCTDEESRRRFRRYWTLIGPFSALIRIMMLRSLRRHVVGS